MTIIVIVIVIVVVMMILVHVAGWCSPEKARAAGPPPARSEAEEIV